MGYLNNYSFGSLTEDLLDFLYLDIEDPISVKIISCDDDDELEEIIEEQIKKEHEIK